MAGPEDHSTLQIGSSVDLLPARRVLTALGPFGVASATLPEQGSFTIGRAGENDLALDDPQISRRHLTIHLGPELVVEDLGGPNGTSLAGQVLRGARAPLLPGQLVELGSTALLVQRSRSPAGQRRVWAHDYLEIRLLELCEERRPLALLTLWADFEEDAAALERALHQLAPPDALIARYAPGQYELLLIGAAVKDAAGLTARVLQAVGDTEGPIRAGHAAVPADGRDPAVLIAVARQRARGVEAGEGDPVLGDAAMRDLYKVADRLAQGRISVLLLGETGVGKEILATHLHASSPRKDRPFVRLNSGALPEPLLESELFGHEAGAFTGAERAKPGLLEAADKGTVFLDEVGELPPAIQVKLLRAIEQREILRVGATRPRSVDVRFIAATHRDLEREVALGRFRQDLYFRLAGAVLTVPPLRERRGEIEPLALRFLAEAAAEQGDEDAPRLSPAARELLLDYDWPGNIRELRNAMERAALLCLDGEIAPEHLPLLKLRSRVLDPPTAPSEAPPLRLAPPPAKGLSPRELEDRARVLEALESHAGNQTRAAQRLGVSRRTLVKKLIKYGLPRPRMSAD